MPDSYLRCRSSDVTSSQGVTNASPKQHSKILYSGSNEPSVAASSPTSSTNYSYTTDNMEREETTKGERQIGQTFVVQFKCRGYFELSYNSDLPCCAHTSDRAMTLAQGRYHEHYAQNHNLYVFKVTYNPPPPNYDSYLPVVVPRCVRKWLLIRFCLTYHLLLDTR